MLPSGFHLCWCSSSWSRTRCWHSSNAGSCCWTSSRWCGPTGLPNPRCAVIGPHRCGPLPLSSLHAAGSSSRVRLLPRGEYVLLQWAAHCLSISHCTRRLSSSMMPGSISLRTFRTRWSSSVSGGPMSAKLDKFVAPLSDSISCFTSFALALRAVLSILILGAIGLDSGLLLPVLPAFSIAVHSACAGAGDSGKCQSPLRWLARAVGRRTGAAG